MQALKVSAKSQPNLVAGALAGSVREHGFAELQAVGAGAVNQAIKAIAVARMFMEEGGATLVCIPSFTEIKIGEEERTAMKFIVELK